MNEGRERERKKGKRRKENVSKKKMCAKDVCVCTGQSKQAVAGFDAKESTTKENVFPNCDLMPFPELSLNQ